MGSGLPSNYYSMNMIYSDFADKKQDKSVDLSGVLRVLKNEGVILLPTDTVWSLACDAIDVEAVTRLHERKASNDPWHFEILVDSVQMLKASIRHLHPRLETLLLYHNRPLSVVIEKKDLSPGFFPLNPPFLTFRVVKHDYCAALIQAFGKPLLTTAAACGDAAIPLSFADIAKPLLSSVDYVVKAAQASSDPGELSVMVKLSPRDELIFLRE